METKMTFQESWHDICHFFQKYLLNTAVPLIFSDDILQNPGIFGNMHFDKRTQVPSINEPAPFNSNGFLNHNHLETWEYMIKEGLIEAFRCRLLGTQTDIETYRARATQYAEVFQDVFGGLEKGSDLKTLITNFLAMMRDYLFCNLPNIEPASEVPAVSALLNKCREEYKARRFCFNKEENVVHHYYIPFEERTYTYALITQTDELANDSSNSKFNHYLIMAELIHTLFVYVYMVEYIKLNPLVKGQSKEEMTPIMKQGCTHNLFNFLKNANYGYYYDLLQQIKQPNKK